MQLSAVPYYKHIISPILVQIARLCTRLAGLEKPSVNGRAARQTQPTIGYDDDADDGDDEVVQKSVICHFFLSLSFHLVLVSEGT